MFRKGEEDGPFSLDQLEALHRKGDVPAATPCRSESDREWHDLGFVLRASEDEKDAETTENAAGREAAVSSVTIREESLFETPRGDPRDAGIRDQVSELIALTRRQNRLLSGIRWVLFGMFLLSVLAAASVAARWFF